MVGQSVETCLAIKEIHIQTTESLLQHRKIFIHLIQMACMITKMILLV